MGVKTLTGHLGMIRCLGLLDMAFSGGFYIENKTIKKYINLWEPIKTLQFV